MKNPIYLCYLLLILHIQVIGAQENLAINKGNEMLVLDENVDLEMPRGFHTSHDNYKMTHSGEALPSREGLASLNQSGSAQFSDRTLSKALPSMTGEIWIVDLRQESHGFINGIPVSWYLDENRSNEKMTTEEIIQAEQKKLAKLKDLQKISVHKITEKSEGSIKKSQEQDINIKTVETEAELAKRLNLHYIRLAALDHHRPLNNIVDQFIAFEKELPANAWLHFHCRGGKGRTTIFMVMNDIIHNGKKLPLDDILKRQILLGGKDLFKINMDQSVKWKREGAIERKQFLKDFYQYVIDPQGYPTVAWSEWVTKHHTNN